MSTLVNPYLYGAPGLTDPYFANVVLLLHMDGANGSQTIVDSSLAAHSRTTIAGTLITSQFKFGTASFNWDNTSRLIYYADSADWDFGSGQFTVEFWARATSAISGIRRLIGQNPGSAPNFGWYLSFNNTTLSFVYSTTGSDTIVVSGTYTPTLNDWDFFAADRDASNVLRVYAGTPAGVSVIGSATAAATIFNSTHSLVIGNDGSNTRGWIGQMDDVRITKGVARYAGTCVPPTAAFPNG